MEVSVPWVNCAAVAGSGARAVQSAKRQRNAAMESILGTSLGVFIGLTVIIAGGAAIMTGRAQADGWKPAWQVRARLLRARARQSVSGLRPVRRRAAEPQRLPGRLPGDHGAGAAGLARHRWYARWSRNIPGATSGSRCSPTASARASIAADGATRPSNLLPKPALSSTNVATLRRPRPAAAGILWQHEPWRTANAWLYQVAPGRQRG